jgi:cold shock CspA family protein
MDPSAAIEEQCRKEAAKLERYFGRITSCRVTIETPHRRRQKGNFFRVTIDLSVPGAEVLVNREPAGHHTAEDFQVALREAFDTARRELEDRVRVVRGQVKAHDVPHASIAKLFPREGHGFLRTPDGREIYFHRNSVLNEEFEALSTGDRVSFHEEPGDKGPQATSVRVIERHPRR